MTTHLIHGFNELHPPGHPRMECLKLELHRHGHDVMTHDYGHWDLVATRNNKNIARCIKVHVKPGDTLVGFSNGAAIIAHLQQMKVNCPRITLIQPALSKKWIPNLYCDNINVYWNHGDKATQLGKWWRRVTNVMPWRWQEHHKWGEMGHKGYTGHDTRFIQFDTENTPNMPVCSGHGTWQKAQHYKWQDFIAKTI